MKVAAFWFQHSPMLGQWADSQTVCRFEIARHLLQAVEGLAHWGLRLQPGRLGGGLVGCEVDLDQLGGRGHLVFIVTGGAICYERCRVGALRGRRSLRDACTGFALADLWSAYKFS